MSKRDVVIAFIHGASFAVAGMAFGIMLGIGLAELMMWVMK